VGIRQGGKQYDSIHRAVAKAALTELATDGFEKLDFAKVAERSGVSERTVYRHYPTKSALGVAAIQQMPDYRGWGDGDDAIADRLRRGLTIGASHRDYLAPVLATASLNRNNAPELMRTLEADILNVRDEQIAKWVDDGKRAKVIRANVDADAVAAALDGILLAHQRGRRGLGTGKVRVERMFKAIWPMIATDPHLND
jgi:AcrR family transcriptional regulator